MNRTQIIFIGLITIIFASLLGGCQTVDKVTQSDKFKVVVNTATDIAEVKVDSAYKISSLLLGGTRELLISDDNNIEFTNDSFTVANFNMQIFGTTKASNPQLMEFYADLIRNHDIIFLQEIRDSSDTAFNSLCDKVKDTHKCVITGRAGRSTSKEQYGIVMKRGIDIIDYKDYNPDSADRWERPPVMITFKVKDYNFTAWNIHTKPDDVPNEMTYLQEVIKDQGNVILLGDLNADCNYYNNVVETQFNNWYWAIGDLQDTTVSQTDCAYDRLIMNNDMKEEYVGSDIYTTGITKDVSDHYLVYGVFSANEK